MEEIKELTQDKLDEITKNGRTVLEFSAAWCPDCRIGRSRQAYRCFGSDD